MKTAAIALRQMKRPNGSVRNVIEQSKYLKSLGYEVVVIAETASPDFIREAEARFVKVIRWPFKGLFRRRVFIYQVERWRRKNPVNLFISHGDTYSDGILAMHNCVWLYSEVSGTRPSDVAPIHDDVIKRQDYKALVVNSELMKRDFIARYGIPERLFEIFYPRVDHAVFNLNDHESLRSQGREYIGVDAETLLFGLVTSGNLFKRNVEFFVRFAAEMSKRSSAKMKFCIFGDADAAPYREIAEKVGVGHLMEFYAPIKNVPIVFHALDMHIFPARLEEFGRVVLEALACGVPSLVSNTVGASELMEKAGLPYVLENDNPGKWAEVALSLIEDPQAHAALSKKSAEFAELYSVERQGDSMEAIIDKVRNQ